MIANCVWASQVLCLLNAIKVSTASDLVGVK